MKFKEQKTYLPKVESLDVSTHFVDAKGKVLGRLASNIAYILQGKNNNNYTPFFHSNVQVWVKNIKEIKITGNKLENKIYYRLFSFEENIIHLISKANLCITRAGASTLSELTYLNVPYLAIPYPLAKDNHQYQNALFYKNKDCCWILQQDQLKNKVLANFLINIIKDKDDYLNKKKNMEKSTDFSSDSPATTLVL